MAFTTKEIRKAFNDATTGPHAAKGRRVTREMMERDEITRTIKEVRKVLPAKGITYVLRRKVSA